MNRRLCTLLFALCATPWLHAQLSGPQGIVFDTAGKLWVANSTANQVQQLDPSTGAVLATITAGLNNPSRLAFGPFGYLYVANTSGNSITVYDSKLNQVVRKTISTHLSKPTGVAVDAYGDVFVSNNASNNIAVFDLDGNFVESLGQDDNGFAFSAPSAIVVHSTELFISIGPDAGKNAVEAYNPGQFLIHNPKPRGEFTDNVNTGPTGV